MIAGAVLFVVAVGIGLYIYNKPHQNIARATPAHTVTANELVADYTGDENAANDKYLGKVIQVTGEIGEIIPGDNETTQILLYTEDPLTSVSCNLEMPRQEVLAMEPASGQTITVKGKCTGVLMDVVLERCVIVSIE